MNERILVNPVAKEQVRLLAIAAETNGAYRMSKGIMLPDRVSGLHYHFYEYAHPSKFLVQMEGMPGLNRFCQAVDHQVLLVMNLTANPDVTLCGILNSIEKNSSPTFP